MEQLTRLSQSFLPHAPESIGLSDRRWPFVLQFSVFNRDIGLFSDIEIDDSHLGRLFPVRRRISGQFEPEHAFYLRVEDSEEQRGFYWNDALLERIDERHVEDPSVLDWKIQLALSLIFCNELTFVHGAAVTIEGSAVLVIGDSRSGKTSLTHEFLKAGADYLTDDCTVIDGEGRVLAYPGDLRIRKDGDILARKIVKPSEYGAAIPDDPLPVSHVIFTEFKEGIRWNPKVIGKGEAVWNLMQNLFYSGVATVEPKSMMERLARAVEPAVCMKGPRGEAAEVVERILEFGK